MYLSIVCVIANFPTVKPVTSESMNYTSAATGLVMLLSAVFWFTTGRKKFTGPDDGNLLAVGRTVA
jgi:choline transport protein